MKNILLSLLLSSAAFVAVDASVKTLSKESVSATIDEVTKLLEDGAANGGSLLSAEAMANMNTKIDYLTGMIDRLDSLTKQLAEKEASVNALLHMANTRQAEILVGRLQETLERETNLRNLEKEQQQKLKETQEEILATPTFDDSIVEVTSDELQERLDTDVILADSEKEMRTWILTLIEEELNQYKTGIFDSVPRLDGLRKDTSMNDSDTTDDCPSTTGIVQKVQQALNDHAEDGIGKVDHAQGATIVHWMTSETYSPPAAPSETLGTVWWSQFIPQDWERLLPSGWENWEVGIPSYLYHSLGFLSGKVAPPEAILQKNTLPGSCWPMEGKNGQVVMKLPYPIVVESISIDHVSGDIVPEGKNNSAPKHIKIIGYPPCDDFDEKCESVGFDMTDPIEIANINYSLEGTSVQTFQSHYAEAMANAPKPVLGEHAETGSCSVQASCSTPPRISVAGVAVKVLENWGNRDFTCLYRVRLHGDPEDV